MKKYLLIVFVMLSVQSFSQEIEKEVNVNEFKCDNVNFDSKSQIFEYSGNVSFKTKIIEFKNAQKIVHDRKSNQITVYGLDEFCIDGAIEISENSTMRTLKYKIGDKVAYIQ